MKSIRIIGLLFLVFISGVVFAQGIPQLLNYQGRLTDDTGLPLDGPVEMRFRLLDADTISASVLWSETQSSVQVNQGIYHVLLGSVNPLPPSALSQADIFLEIRVDGEIQRPRSQLTSVPFAHKAASVPDSSITSAMIADGTIIGSDIDSQTIASTNIADGTITSMQIQDNSLGTEDIQDIYVLNTGDTVTGNLRINGNIGIGMEPDSSYGIINEQATAPAYGANFTGSLYGGWFTWSTDPFEHYALTGGEEYGVYGRAGGLDETGTRQGGYFYGESQGLAVGLSAYSYGWGTTDTYGVFGRARGYSSGDVYGGIFSTDSGGGGVHYGVFARSVDYAGWFEDGKVHVGDGGTEDYVDGDGDHYVEDELEVDGDAYFSGDIDAPGAIDSSDLAAGAVMAINIGEDCEIGEALIRTSSGWACGNSFINSNIWTWMSGDTVTNQNGVYGTKGTPGPANVPGARGFSVSWTEPSGNFWLFGGFGYPASGGSGDLNDLWRWDGTNWTWMSGSDVINQNGVYGTKGTPDPANIPGSRDSAVSWTDPSGNFWLFGGSGYAASGGWGILNDLWRFDGTNWTWMSGSNGIYQTGVYGIKGTPDPANIPGARSQSVSWTDSSGNLWLFGGEGYTASSFGLLNDLWRFDGTNWTWMSGDTVTNQHGVYGFKYVPDPANFPGSRRGSASWTDSSGNFWLFGGYGYSDSGFSGSLNDLWIWGGSNWTWMSGDTVTNQYGVYGTKGTPDPANFPGSREDAVFWTDSSGNFWLFGGGGYDTGGGSGRLNDLWRWGGTLWTWISGSNVRDQNGAYGTKGNPNPANIPGGRVGAVSWIDTSGNLWLFGGYGYPASGSLGFLNDLWRYKP